MKLTIKSGLLALLLSTGVNLPAQEKPADSINDRPKPIPRHPLKIAPRDRQKEDAPVNTVVRPELARTDELKLLIERFQAARQNYLLQQRELMQQLGDGTEQQREELRELLRDNLEKWREMQVEFRNQLRDRARELREQLSSELGRVVDSAREEGEGEGRPRN